MSALVALLLMATACGDSAPVQRPVPPVAVSEPASVSTLKFRVLQAACSSFVPCDVYRIAARTPLDKARARFPSIKAHRSVFDAILQHEDLSAGQTFTPKELIAASNDYKRLQSIRFKPSGDGFVFDFQLSHGFNCPDANGFSNAGVVSHVTGTVSRFGAVTIHFMPRIPQQMGCP